MSMLNRSLELTPDEQDAINNIIAAETQNFTELVSLSGLSKARDFKFLDLSLIDFSNCDLRDYDFTGSNLSGAHGVNVRVDETTIFTNATLDNSIFALEQERREFLQNNLKYASLLKRLSKEYWANGTVWVVENIRHNSTDLADKRRLAKFLYSSVKDETYKSQILYSLSRSFDDKREYGEFLKAQIADPNITISSLRTIISIFRGVFLDDGDVQVTLKALFDHPAKTIRSGALRSFFKPSLFKKHKHEILDAMRREWVPENRTEYTKSFAMGLLGDQFLFLRNDTEWFLDYQDPITFDEFLTMAVARAKLERAGKESILDLHRVRVTNEAVLEILPKVDEQICVAIAKGFPAKIAYRLDDPMVEVVRNRRHSWTYW